MKRYPRHVRPQLFPTDRRRLLSDFLIGAAQGLIVTVGLLSVATLLAAIGIWSYQ